MGKAVRAIDKIQVKKSKGKALDLMKAKKVRGVKAAEKLEDTKIIRRRPKIEKTPKHKKKKIKKKFKGQSRTERIRALSEQEDIINEYVDQKCAFMVRDRETGKMRQCQRKAVGKSTLCDKHGGETIDKDELVCVEEMSLLCDEKGMIASFKPDEHPILYVALSKDGMSDVEIAGEFGVSIETIKIWADKFALFNTAFEIGKAMYEAWWLKKGRENLNQRNFNTSLYKFLTGNKLGFSDKIETKSTNLHAHGVMVVPDAVSASDWESQNKALEQKREQDLTKSEDDNIIDGEIVE